MAGEWEIQSSANWQSQPTNWEVWTGGAPPPPPPPPPPTPEEAVGSGIGTRRITSNKPRVHVHNGFGERIGTLTSVNSINRQWAIMKPGQCSFRVNWNEPLLRHLDPRIGNVIVIESDYYPVPWVGGLVGVEEAAYDVRFSGVSIDAVLRERYTTNPGEYSGSAGSVIKEVMSSVEGANFTGFLIGSVANGPPWSIIAPDKSIYSVLNGIAIQTGHEWWLHPDVRIEGIAMHLNFADAMGFDRYEGVRLWDGGNCTRVASGISLAGSLWSVKVIAGQINVAEAFTERSRESLTLTNNDPNLNRIHGSSVEHYDISGSPLTRREQVIIAEQLKSREYARTATEALMGRPKNAERMLRLLVTDRSIWSALDVGSKVRFTSDTAYLRQGIDGPVRIVSVQPMDEMQDLELVCQVLDQG